MFPTIYLGLALFVPVVPGADDPPPTPEAAEEEELPSFSPEEFLIVPVRIHLLAAEELPSIHTQLDTIDILRITGKANGIWRAAGIRFAIDSLVREEAVDQGRVGLTQSLGAGNLTYYLALRPQGTQSGRLLHVYFVHRMEVNGVFLGEGTSFVQDTARLRPVEGGIDEPIPRVMSHELGHALGLGHRQDRTNLMASGTNGTSLNRAEVLRARERAQKLSFVFSAEETARRAREHHETGQWLSAVACDSRLVGLPGSSPLKDEAWSRIAATSRSLFGALAGGVARVVPATAAGSPSGISAN